jgi:amino acid transporter
MAEDGLMPRAFAALDKDGNLFKGTLLLGVAMTIIAVCVPFDPLNDMVSAGCLIAVNLTNACIITVNHESKKPVLAGRISWALFILSGVCAFMWHDSLEIENPTIPVWVSGTMTAATVGLAIYLKVVCTTGEKAGNPVPPFQVPFLPFTPLFGMFCNWYLISALSVVGLLQITGFILLALLQYYLYGYHHSVAHKNDWRDILDAAGLKQRENSYDIDNSLNGDALVDPL